MYHQTDEQFYSWLAGLIDGDGCLSIAPQHPKSSPYIRVAFSVTIGLKVGYEFVLEYAQKRSGLGHIYRTNQGLPNESVRWQTTNLEDARTLVSLILPYLVLKKAIAIKFLACVQFSLQTKVTDGNRKQGTLRKNAEMKSILKSAIDLNYDRQSIRYRSKKGLDYWNTLVDELYPS
jgi:hypothetical protein